jgi:hypothetical protein
MSQHGIPKFWLIKESIKLVAKEFIDQCPELHEFEEFILSYCKEIDSNSPKNARKRLKTLFKGLDQIQGSDAKKEFFRRKIAEIAAKSVTDGKKTCIRAVIETYRNCYIRFAMQHFLEKFNDRTLSYEQAFQGEEVKEKKFKKRFIEKLNEEFATAHPEEANLQEEYGFAQKGQLRDLRFCNLLSMFRTEHPDGHSRRGLCLLSDAAGVISENSALSGPSARCLLQFFSSFHCRSSSLTLTWVATAAARVLWNRRCASPAAQIGGVHRRRPRSQV